MTRPLPTFSSLLRAFRCRASAVLPGVEERTEAANDGTLRHHFLRRVSDLTRGGTPLAQARALALAEAPADARWELALIPLDELRLKDVVAEVAVAIDIVTGEARVLGRAIERRYDEAGRRPTEIAGSIDAVALIGQDGALVRDYKGRTHDRSPERDPQLLAGGLAVMKLHRRRWVDLEVTRLVNGRPFPVKKRVAAPDLDRFGKQLQTLGRRIQEDRAAYDAGRLPDCTTGDHCGHCSSYRFCPAKGALARAALGAELPEILRLAQERKPYLTPDNAALVRERLIEVERVVKLVKADLAGLARQAPIQQRDGKVYGLTRSGRVAAHRPPRHPRPEAIHA
jgi:RecB family exonuclease